MANKIVSEIKLKNSKEYQNLSDTEKSSIDNFYNLIQNLNFNKIAGEQFNEKDIGIYIYRMIKRYFAALFKWKGLPKGLTSDWINKILLEHGQGVFFKVFDKIYFLPYITKSISLQNGEPYEITPKNPIGFVKTSNFENKTSESNKIFNLRLIFDKFNVEKSTAVPISMFFNKYSLKDLIGQFPSRLNQIYTAIKSDLWGATNGAIIFAENGSEIGTLSDLTTLFNNFSFFKILTGVKKGNVLFGENNQIAQMKGESHQSDFWNSFKNTFKLMFMIIGITGGGTNEKTSGTQETDSQTQGDQSLQSVLMSGNLSTMRTNLSHCRTLFNFSPVIEINVDVIDEFRRFLSKFQNLDLDDLKKPEKLDNTEENEEDQED